MLIRAIFNLVCTTNWLVLIETDTLLHTKPTTTNNTPEDTAQLQITTIKHNRTTAQQHITNTQYNQQHITIIHWPNININIQSQYTYTNKKGMFITYLFYHWEAHSMLVMWIIVRTLVRTQRCCNGKICAFHGGENIKS